MKPILDQIYQRWPHMRTVLNVAALETLAEVTGWLEEHSAVTAEIVQISAARTKPAGRYHMMQGGTVIYVITIQGKTRT